MRGGLAEHGAPRPHEEARVYARAGVAHAWLVEPLVRTLEIYRLENGCWVVAATHGGEERIAAVEPFTGLVLNLSRWWLEAVDESSR